MLKLYFLFLFIIQMELNLIIKQKEIYLYPTKQLMAMYNSYC